MLFIVFLMVSFWGDMLESISGFFLFKENPQDKDASEFLREIFLKRGLVKRTLLKEVKPQKVFLMAMAERKHLNPFRTQQLSSPAPMILLLVGK